MSTVNACAVRVCSGAKVRVGSPADWAYVTWRVQQRAGLESADARRSQSVFDSQDGQHAGRGYR